MESESGIPLSEKEIALIKQLEKLAKKWKKDGKDLWLWSAAGNLHVMLKGDTKRNSSPMLNKRNGGVNKGNLIRTIYGITNDGGDW